MSPSGNPLAARSIRCAVLAVLVASTPRAWADPQTKPVDAAAAAQGSSKNALPAPLTSASMESELWPAPGSAANQTKSPTTIGVPPGPATAAEPPSLPLAPSGSPADRLKWLAARIEEILARASLTGARIAVDVAEVDTGKVLYAKNERTLLNPASNAKLVTTAAALGLLGPEFRYKTSLLADSVKGGDVQGPLYLRGNGDPSLVIEDLWRLVATLASQGVKKINGPIAIDDSAWDDQRIAPAFEQKEDDSPFRAPNGAVSLNYNSCSVHVIPAPKEGAPPRVFVEPASPYFVILNQAKTIKKGKAELTVNTREIEGHTQVVVAGAVHPGSPERVDHKRIIHPDLYAGYTLRELLSKRGIKVTGDVVRALPPAAPILEGSGGGSKDPAKASDSDSTSKSSTSAPTIPARLKVLVTHASQPLGVIVREVNKTSNNFMAEQILKTLGAEIGGKPGTWPKGVEAVGKFLDGMGIASSRYKMLNGSGLYDANRFTAAQIIELLRAAYRDFRWASDFVGSLAVAGTEGTIGHRLEGSPAARFVRAKTGTLNGVSCLSGYAGALGHMPLVFSILMNDVSEGSTGEARKAQDAIAEALVTFLDAK